MHLQKLLAYLWAGPASCLGVALALVLSLAVRCRWCIVDGVVEVAPAPRARLSSARSRLRWPFAAITFGHVVIGASPGVLQALRAHEHAHVRQYERWGPLLLIAYPLASALMLLRGRRPYIDNPFEVQAREAEELRP